MSAQETNAAYATTEAVSQHSRGKLIAFLAAQWRDVVAAEDALQQAFEAALVNWPLEGCPQNPEAWLLTVARRKLIDSMRRNRDSGDPEDLDRLTAEDEPDADEIPDRRLALLFACAHPAIDAAIRAPLMLQVVLGLEASQIASAFLMSPAAMAQRLVRAKAKIRHAGIPFRVPERAEMAERLEVVLEAVYAGFTEGWVDAAGTDEARRELAGEAIYLGRLLTVAGARRTPGRFQLEAAIQSAHVERRRTGTVAWPAILELYAALVKLTGSPVAQINRAVALAEVEGADAGLEALAAVEADERIRAYQPYWAARAELLARTGARDDAQKAYEIAIGMESDPAVRRFLEEKRDRSDL